MLVKDLGEDEGFRPWSKVDAFMLFLCFLAFAVLGYFLANHILS
jgi:hypothetical protein